MAPESTADPVPGRDNIFLFVSYSHSDRKWLEELRPYLLDISRRAGLELYYDVQTESGADWTENLQRTIQRAHVAVLLVSARYLASNFIARYELPELLKAAANNKLPILWIPVSASPYHVTPVSELQAASDPRRPLDSLPNSRRHQEWERIASQITVAAGVEPPDPERKQRKIALLYKRRVKPDQDLVDAICNRLTRQQFDVFLDRNMTASVTWGQEIIKSVQTADVVVPFLSRESVTSEMLAYEVSVAAEAAQTQAGTPRLLPVRIRYNEKTLPDAFEILNPIHHFEWDADADTDRLVSEIVDAAQGAMTIERASAIPASGPAPAGDNLYIEREVDHRLREAMADDQETLILIKGARQMGRTSLLGRGLRWAESNGCRTIYTDFQRFNASQLSSLESMYRTLAESITDDRNDDLEWKIDKPPNANLNRFLKRNVLGREPNRVVWGLDEVDRLFAYPYASEFFGLIRSWHNERSIREGTPWERLTVVIAYATEPFLFIQDLNQSPFAIGLKLQVDDLALNQVMRMNDLCRNPLKSSADVQAFYRLIGGHPALVRRGLDILRTVPFTRFMDQASRDDGPFGDHLRRVLVELSKSEDLLAAVQSVLKGANRLTSEQYFRLIRAGILKGDTPRSAQLRCDLYRKYLQRHLLQQSNGSSDASSEVKLPAV